MAVRGTPENCISDPTNVIFRVRKRGLLEKWSFGKGVFWKRGLLEIRDSRDLENPQTLENKGESDRFLESLENLENVEILEIPPVKRPLS